MRYLIWGYYGWGNLGDDLMLLALREGIRKNDTKAQIFVRCRGILRVKHVIPFNIETPRSPVGFLTRILRYAHDYVLRIIRLLHNIDVLVIGGGTLFIDKGLHNRSLFELVAWSWLARLQGRRIYLVGVGIDRLTHKTTPYYMRQLFKLSNKAWVREQWNAQEINLDDLSSRKVQRSADLVYTLPWKKSSLNIRTKTAFIFADYHDYYAQSPGIGRIEIINAFAQFIRKNRGSGLDPTFFVFQEGIGFKGDRIALEIAQACGIPHIPIQILVPDMCAIEAAFSDIGVTVGMHYHALVLSSIFQIPFLAVGHERKFEDITECFRMPLIPIQALNPDTLERAWKTARKASIDLSILTEQESCAHTNFDWTRNS